MKCLQVNPFTSSHIALSFDEYTSVHYCSGYADSILFAVGCQRILVEIFKNIPGNKIYSNLILLIGSEKYFFLIPQYPNRYTGRNIGTVIQHICGRYFQTSPFHDHIPLAQSY